MKNNILVGVITGLVVLVGAYFVLPRVQNTVERVIGSSPGPSRSNSQECIDDVCFSYRSADFKTSTSTPAAFKNPAATSTAFVTIAITAATTSDYVLILSENIVPYARPEAAATSSGSQGGVRRLAEWVVPANTTPVFVWDSSTTTTQSSDVNDALVTSPNSYLVVSFDDGGLRFPEGVSSTGISGEVKAVYTEFR